MNRQEISEMRHEHTGTHGSCYGADVVTPDRCPVIVALDYADSLERPCANCDCTLVRCYDARMSRRHTIACCPECDHRERKVKDGH